VIGYALEQQAEPVVLAGHSWGGLINSLAASRPLQRDQCAGCRILPGGIVPAGAACCTAVVEERLVLDRDPPVTGMLAPIID